LASPASQNPELAHFKGLVKRPHAAYPKATVIEYQLVLATRNVRDFMGCGVQVVNPFDGV
jgi:hypothetical protein